MLLTIDCGNTNTVFALYAYDLLLFKKDVGEYIIIQKERLIVIIPGLYKC